MIRLITYKTGGAIYVPNFIDEETSNGAFNVISKTVQFETKYINIQCTLIVLYRSTVYYGDNP